MTENKIRKNIIVNLINLIKEDDCLIDYIVKTRFFMPKYNQYTIPISNAMYNEELPEALKYDLLMSTYKDVRKAFNK